MIHENRVRIIGTSHVSKESKQRINDAFGEFKPDIICIELDNNRFQAISSPEKKKGLPSIHQLGITGFLFAVIGRALQKKMGNLTGMAPGEEMLLGATLAKNNKLQLELIDQDAAITLRNMSKRVKFLEKLRIFLDIFRAPFSKKLRMNMKLDIHAIPDEEVIAKVMTMMKDRYPGFYRVLLDDRNRYMSKRIYSLMKNNPDKKVMVIVGAGHVEGMQKYLKSLMESNIY
jgi:pheromone shutdown-related protein TraB